MRGALTRRVIVVTGATRGAGRATALRLAAEGARVVATGRDADAGDETVRLVEEAAGSCVFVPHDVTVEADWDRVIDMASSLGGLHGLVNYANIFVVGPIADTTEADFDAMLSVNVEGTFLGIKYAFQAFAAGRRPGVIVNVSSLMGLVGYPEATVYCATKGALTGMTRAAALDGAAMDPKVRVNTLYPGVIWTEVVASHFGENDALAAAFAAETPLRMAGRPEHMAEAVAFLIGDESSFMTGAELTVDGGRAAH